MIAKWGTYGIRRVYIYELAGTYFVRFRAGGEPKSSWRIILRESRQGKTTVAGEWQTQGSISRILPVCQYYRHSIRIELGREYHEV